MKKIFSLILVMLMTCILSIPVMASSFAVSTDVDALRAGDQVTVTIKLDKDIKVQDDITNVQGELYYDSSVLSYVSHELDKDYENYMAKDRSEKERFQFSCTSMTNEPFQAAKGKVVTVVFETVKEIPEPELESAFELKMKLSTSKAETTEHTAEAWFVICQEHVDMNQVTLPEPSKDAKETEDTSDSAAEDARQPETQETQSESDATEERKLQSESDAVDDEQNNSDDSAEASDSSVTDSEKESESVASKKENNHTTEIAVLVIVLVSIAVPVICNKYQRK